jgi:hypothetical protein
LERIQRGGLSFRGKKGLPFVKVLNKFPFVGKPRIGTASGGILWSAGQNGKAPAASQQAGAKMTH